MTITCACGCRLDFGLNEPCVVVECPRCFAVYRVFLENTTLYQQYALIVFQLKEGNKDAKSNMFQ